MAVATKYSVFTSWMATKGFKPEIKFHEKRKWKFDYANHKTMVALEVEGGLWIGGRHNRAPGMIKDMEKYNEAALMGWRVLRVTPQMVLKDGTAYLLVDRSLEEPCQ